MNRPTADAPRSATATEADKWAARLDVITDATLVSPPPSEHELTMIAFGRRPRPEVQPVDPEFHAAILRVAASRGRRGR